MIFPELVVIPCGGKKRTHPAPAWQLYTGSFFTQCHRAARALRPTRGYLILSALHGLTSPHTVIHPYDLRMGQPGSVTPDTLQQQAHALGLDALTRVVVLSPRDYARAALTVWPHADTPLLNCPGIGHQKHMLSTITTRGRL